MLLRNKKHLYLCTIMASIKHWIAALRPRTLFLATATALSGSAMAYSVGKFSWIVFFLTIAIANILQLLSNLANDLGDYQHGTDVTGERIGPVRMMQSGAISYKEMKKAIFINIAIAACVGLLLIYEALQFLSIYFILLFLFLGVCSILAAIKYTAGSNPYGYKGLGDIFSFVFFGPVSVVGTFFLHTHSLTFQPWLPAIGLGFLTVAVLNINNMRDRDNDLKSGKITIAIKLGYIGAKRYHACLVLGSFICFLVYSIMYSLHWYNYIYLAVFIYHFRLLKDIYEIIDNRKLDPYLGYTSLGTFVLALLYSFFINI